MEKLLARFENESLYDILQVERGANSETIKKSFKSRIKENHPDKNKAIDARI